MGLNRCCVATEAPELDEFLGGRGMVVLSFGQICVSSDGIHPKWCNFC